MSELRPTIVVLLAFATGLAALALAGVTAWLRCGRGSDCSTELALAIVAFSPACLIGLIVALLMRIRADVWWLRTSLLAVGVGVAGMPLAAFLLRDVKLVPAFAALVAVVIFLIVMGERQELEAAAAEREDAAAPEPDVQPLQESGALPELPMSVASPRVERALIVLQQLAALNNDVIRLCESLPRLARGGPATTTDEYRR